VLIIGELGFAASFTLYGFVAENGLEGRLWTTAVFVLLIISRAVGGTFSSATIPTAQAYVADVTGREDRTSGMAMIGAAFGLGVIFGPAIGAALATVSLLAPVYFSAGLAVLNAAFIAVRLKEPERRSGPRSSRGGTSLVARVWPLLGIGLALSLASVAMEQTIAFYFQDRLALSATRTAQTVGIALVFYGVVAVLAQGVLVRRFRWTPMQLLAGGLPCALAGFVGLFFSHEFVSLAASLALQGLGHGLALPGVTAAVSLGVGEDEQGAAAGLNSSSQALGRLLGPVVGTGLYELHPEYPYMLSVALLMIVVVALTLSRRLRNAMG
jgi:MFS family permease